MPKSTQLQLRVSPEQKDRIKKQAALAGEDVSKWVLKKLLPAVGDQLQQVIDKLGIGSTELSLILAEIHDILLTLSAKELEAAVSAIDLMSLQPFESNYVAAMIETACVNKRLRPPAWLGKIAPLADPWFASGLKSLRLHLLKVSPPAFRRRNLFVDSTLGDRV